MFAHRGDRVRVRFIHMQDAQTHLREPPKAKVLEFTIGSEHILPGLSRCVLGMRQGEQKCVTLTPAEAYGDVQARLIKEVPRPRFHTKAPLTMGMLLMARGSGSVRGRKVRVVGLNPDSIVVDANHPWAGQALNLSMYLVSVDPSSEANESKPQTDSGSES